MSNKQEELNRQLYQSAVAGDYEAVNQCLDAGADVNTTAGEDRRTPLHAAAEGGFSELVEHLLLVGADFTAKDNNECTPLHLAALNGHEEVCQELLFGGADPETPMRWNITPLHQAAGAGHHEVVAMFLENGADPMLTCNQGDTAAILAAREGHQDVLMTLADYDERILAVANSNGSTCAHEAARYDHVGVLAYLHEMGQDLRAQDNRGETPMHAAASSSQGDAVQFLIDHGARDDLNTPERSRDTPLHWAARYRNAETAGMCQVMIDNGADPHLIGHNGDTAMSAARDPFVKAVIGAAMEAHALRARTDKVAEFSPPVLGPESARATCEPVKQGHRQGARMRL